MAGNNQTWGWNQSINKRNNTRDSKTKTWFFEKNQQDRQSLSQTNEKAETVPKLTKSEMKRET